MKKIRTLLKLFLVTAISSAAVLTFGTISGFAMDTGYTNAIECSLNTGNIDGTISSETDSKWYKFTVPSPNACYSFKVKNMPSPGMYSFEIYYQENENETPKIYRVKTTLNTSGDRTATGMLKNPGTYYVRVYSYTGGNLAPYTFIGNIGYGAYAFGVSHVYEERHKLDWAACAEMAGKRKRSMDMTGILATSRNLETAVSFVQSGGTSENIEITVSKPSSLEDIATAANYIYSGGYMVNPLFKVKTNYQYPLAEMLELYREKSGLIIMRLMDIGETNEKYSHYVLLNYVDQSTNKIGVKDPWYSSTIDMKCDYVEFINNGYEKEGYDSIYTGDNIVCEQ